MSRGYPRVASARAMVSWTRAWLVALGCVGALCAVFSAPALADGTWSPQASGTGSNLAGVSFVNVDRGWAVGDSGTILATGNGGATWSAQASGTANNLAGVSFVEASHGWAVGAGGTILATGDGGATWRDR